MLVKSGIDMFDTLVDFFSKSTKVQIYSAYIKFNALTSLIDRHLDKVECVCVRWQPQDLIRDSSDLDVYKYLKRNNIPLYINNRLHLKAYIDNYRRCYVGSNNISQRALGLSPKESCNYEVGCFIPELSISDRLYYSNIMNEAILMDDRLFEKIEAFVADQKNNREAEEYDFPIKNMDRDFLISALPICENVTQFTDIYFHGSKYDDVAVQCMLHDVALYGIPLSTKEDDLISYLKQGFFTQPFICSFINNLLIKRQVFFGEAKQWLQENCTDVPVPKKWEITKNVQILFRWIQELGDGKYIIDRPNYSECLICK